MSLPPEIPPNEELPAQPRPRMQPQQAHVEVTMQRPIVTYVLLGITLLFYVVQLLENTSPVREVLVQLGKLVFSQQVEAALSARGLYEGVVTLIQDSSLSLLVMVGGKINAMIAIGQAWRLFTPALLHTNLIQIAFNLFALYSFGRALEPFYGGKRFLALYWLAVFGGNVLSYLFSSRVSTGAATGVFGLVAAQGVFLYQNRTILGPRARSNLTTLVIVIGLNLLLGLLPGLDNWASLGGLMAGLAFSWSAGPLFMLAGDFPLFHLEDRRSPRNVWLAAALVALVIAVMAIIGKPAL